MDPRCNCSIFYDLKLNYNINYVNARAGHMRPSSPLLDSMRDQFEGYDQLAKDFGRVFMNEEPSCLQNAQLFDVVFMVGQSKQKTRFIGVRAILGVRSRVFQVFPYPRGWNISINEIYA